MLNVLMVHCAIHHDGSCSRVFRFPHLRRLGTRQIIRSNSPYFDLVYRAPPNLLLLPTSNEALLPSIEYGEILELFLVFAGLPPWGKFYFLSSPKCFWHCGRAFAFLHFISTVIVTSKLQEICDVKPLHKLKGIFLDCLTNSPTDLKQHIRHAFSSPTSSADHTVSIYPWFKLFYLIVLSSLSALPYRETK